MIQGVEIKKLKIMPDERGFLMEILRSDDPLFRKFGQVYMTGVKKGVAKAWHYHKLQDDFFTCVAGQALVVLYDGRNNSPTYGQTEEYRLAEPTSDGEHILLKIPAGVIHGFTAVNSDEARIVNIPTELYNYKTPDECRYPWDSPDIPYKWPPEVKMGG